MKKRVVLLLTCLFLWVSSIFAQDVPVGVVVAFKKGNSQELNRYLGCLLYTSPSPRDPKTSRMPSSA